MPFTIQFLGVGGAFTVPTTPKDLNTCLMQSNMVLTAKNGKKMLIDCGTYIPLSAATMGFTAADFDTVYISHVHADHCGGLEWLAFNTFFNPSIARPRLLCHPDVLNDLHAIVMPGISKAQGIQTFESYFNVETPENILNVSCFAWEGLVLTMVPVVHVEDEFLPMYSYGLRIEDNNGAIVWISADTVYDRDFIIEMAQDSNMIFHDCETTNFHTAVHSHYSDLYELPKDVKCKMMLYHYDSASSNELNATADGFGGFVLRGQKFRF